MRCCRLGRWVVAMLALVATMWSFGGPAAAHTGFESSTPADGDAVDEAVSEVVIRFTGEATPAGEGFTVLDPAGVVRSPWSVTTEDNKVFVLQFEPPLAGGPVGVRWMVQAQDSHPIEGSFSFTVTAPAPSSTAPPTTAPPTTAGSETTAASETTALPESATSASASPDGGDDGSAVTLEEFLTTATATPGEGRQRAGRVVSYLGVIAAIGCLAFVGSTLRGTHREIDLILRVVAGLGVLTAVAAGIEYWGWIAQSEGTLVGELASTPGLAMALRVAGGLIVAAALATGARAVAEAPRQAQSLSASAMIEMEPIDAADAPVQRWDPRSTPLTWAGASLLVASFWFDGHTVSKGPRIVHAAVNSVHVVAAAVWVGGVMTLLALLVARRRRSESSRAAELVVRFSSTATIALIAVVLAGAVMAVFVLDSPGELTSTEWGRTLLLKTAAVGIAALGGAHNHFRLRPRLLQAPDDIRLRAELRSTLIFEAVVFTFVIVVTAWLVAAAT